MSRPSAELIASHLRVICSASKTTIIVQFHHYLETLINFRGINVQNLENYSFIQDNTRSRNFANKFIGHVLNEQGTGYEHIFSWYEYSISIELKMGPVI